MLAMNRKLSIFISLLVTFSLKIFPAYGQQLTLDQEKAIRKANQGKLIPLKSILDKWQQIPVIPYQQVVLPGPQFIISDNPEYIREPEAIALQENVNAGRVRLYLYNVNGVRTPSKMPRKITAVIKNIGDQPMRFRMLKYSSQPPGQYYRTIGKTGLADYFLSTDNFPGKTIAPGEVLPIDKKSTDIVVRYNELVHGIYEFVIDQPAQISVIQTAPGKPASKALKDIDHILPLSNHSGAGRGLYGISNYQINTMQVYSTEDGPKQLLLADNKVDKWIIGNDAPSGTQVENMGNYGVMYYINMRWKSPDGKALALVTWNPGCPPMSASLKVSKGRFKEGFVQIPKKRPKENKDYEDKVMLIQLFIPDKSQKVQHINITYSPPGASCLPTPLLFIPVKIQE